MTHFKVGKEVAHTHKIEQFWSVMTRMGYRYSNYRSSFRHENAG
jgi:hypothetical protein